MSPNPYAAVHARASLRRGPAKYHCCYFCGLRARDWALNREADAEIKRAPSRMKAGRRIPSRDYADSVDAYIPLCRGCHRAYDHARDMFDRRARWNAVLPDLRERARAQVARAHAAWKRFTGRHDAPVERACEQCNGPFWTTRGDTWCLFCRWPDVAAIVGDRRPRPGREG
ncbi:hypothetical protein ACWDTQ_04095 [Streptomyces cellulosae]|uniref:hypothetical protein n=1 Tax=Streptomyces sp. enrichment culture TaxID=1795815 RepID=UPI003F5572A7